MENEEGSVFCNSLAKEDSAANLIAFRGESHYKSPTAQARMCTAYESKMHILLLHVNISFAPVEES